MFGYYLETEKIKITKIDKIFLIYFLFLKDKNSLQIYFFYIFLSF